MVVKQCTKKGMMSKAIVDSSETNQKIDSFNMNPGKYQHQEAPNEDYFECRNDYLEGSMGI